jgi:hypothetical protein
MMQDRSFAFGGGLDVVSAALALPPGRLRSGLNYEPLAEGYGRVDGYERFDGRGSPSSRSYWLLPFDTGVSAITAGMTITGGTSGATGIVLLEPVGFTGNWSGTGAGTLVLGNVSGTFQDNEQLLASTTLRALAAGPAAENSADTAALDETYTEAAQDYQRSLIAKVPGSGPVRGVAELGGVIYAWRDNAGGTYCDMWRATAAGWVQVTLGTLMLFDQGLAEIAEGVNISGASSGAIATVRRVVRQSGDWGSSAAGYLVLSGLSGPFTSGETLVQSAANVARAGTASQIRIQPGGKFHTINHNFYGAAERRSMYGANGVSNGFEFDGTHYVPIRTGMPNDQPTRVFEIANHLGFTFPGGSVQFSGIGEPVLFDVTLGAGEIGFGTEVTDVVQANETAVVLFGQQKISILNGSDAESFALAELTEEAGAEAWTAQRVGTTVYLDRRGLRDLRATQAFGNFKTGTLSALIEPYFRVKRKAGAVPVLSLVSRSKTHYRLYWSDGTGLSVYMGGKAPEAIPFELGGMQPYCGTTCELADGTEGIFIGGEDGYVYRMDSGPSFDGTGVQGFVMSPYNHFQSSMQDKRFRKVTLEMQAQPLTRIGVMAQYNYGDGTTPISGNKDFDVVGSGEGLDFLVQGGGGNFDLDSWNTFFWSSPSEGIAEADIDGFGRNASFIFACKSAKTEGAHVLQAYTVRFSPRRRKP